MQILCGLQVVFFLFNCQTPGTSVQGGRGNYLGTIAGAISFVVLEDFLVILNMPEAGRNIALGVLIIALVLFYKKDGHTR